MPNFWTRTIQYFSEKLSGARTLDSDFEKVCKKMSDTEKGLSQLKTCLQNILPYTQSFVKYFEDINSALQLIYDDTPYYEFTEEILCKHQIIQSQMIENFNKKLNKLYLRTSEWENIFTQAKMEIELKEKNRKVYDHYEEKLVKITKGGWKSKDEKYVGRNEAKYSKAASDYVEVSEKAFETIHNSLKLTWELTNPIVSDIVNIEKDFFKDIYTCLNCFVNNNERFTEIKNNLYNPNSNKDIFTYDPVKFMNEKDLIKRVSVSRNIGGEGPYNIGGRPNANDVVNRGRGGTTINYSNSGNKPQVKHEGYGTENLCNIYTNLRMTNSFGKENIHKVNEFLEIDDEFS